MPNCSAEYTVAPAISTWKLADTTKFEDAVTLPLAAMTAAQALFINLGLKEPQESGRGHATGIVVINSASGSVGSFAVQLAKNAGYTVVAIAGNASDYVKSLGAERVIDYRGKSDEALAKDINAARASFGKPLAGIFDANSSESTILMLANLVPDIRGGRIALVNPPPATGVRDDVTPIFTFVSRKQ